MEKLNEQEEKSQLVQMRLQPKTLQRLQSLVDLTKTDNRTQLVSTSIQLAEEIIRSLKAGSKVYIENKNGEKESLRVIGI
jgi:flagellar biosynthesis/type III secretory pathway protein FliH